MWRVLISPWPVIYNECICWMAGRNHKSRGQSNGHLKNCRSFTFISMCWYYKAKMPTNTSYLDTNSVVSLLVNVNFKLREYFWERKWYRWSHFLSLYSCLVMYVILWFMCSYLGQLQYIHSYKLGFGRLWMTNITIA